MWQKEIVKIDFLTFGLVKFEKENKQIPLQK